VVLRFPGLELAYEDLLEVQLEVPYCPGFLGFRCGRGREAPRSLLVLQSGRALLPPRLLVRVRSWVVPYAGYCCAS
jgi:hypothetical protein